MISIKPIGYSNITNLIVFQLVISCC